MSPLVFARNQNAAVPAFLAALGGARQVPSPSDLTSTLSDVYKRMPIPQIETLMPRTREFEPKDALDAAMRVFWAKGYSETSYDDLVQGTGVSRKGLYTVFGGKHKLFLAALRNYRMKIIPYLLEDLAADHVTTDDIRGTFLNLAEMAATERGHVGCFLACTSADIAISEPDVKDIIDLHWRDLNTRLHRALLKAGYETARADRLAPYLVGVMQGLFTLAHARADQAIIEPFVEEALTVLN